MKTQLFHLTLKSDNGKTGPIPVSTSPASTCPDSCPLKSGGCYAKSGPLKLHWDAVSDNQRGVYWAEFISAIKSLPANQLWRHNQAGDLPGCSDSIDATALAELARANAGKRGFTYTHKPPTKENLRAIKAARKAGFIVNLSANSPAHADKLLKHGLPVVTVLPTEAIAHKSAKTPNGAQIIVCPATRSEKVNCSTCGLCQKAERPFVIGFPAHGTSKKKADFIAKN